MARLPLVGGIGIMIVGLLLAGLLPSASIVTARPSGEKGHPDNLYAPRLEAALWNDPQFFPHPAYGWATLTHVPRNAPSWWQPIPKAEVPENATGLERVAFSPGAAVADGMAIFGRLAVNPGFKVPPLPPAATPQILDLSDPLAPKPLKTLETNLTARDADFIAYPDGRLVVVLNSDQGVLAVVDVTDPTEPEVVKTIDLPGGGHTSTVVPGTPILYQANAAGPLGTYPHRLFAQKPALVQTEIFNLSDPKEPDKKVWENGLGCHMITFYVDVTRNFYRGYCAAPQRVQIWDIADPWNPRIITDFNFPDPNLPPRPEFLTLAHSVTLNADATVMAISDESTMGLIAPGCSAHDRAGGQTLTGPNGNVWFYDIRDEKRPRLVGSLSANLHLATNPPPYALGFAGSCTAHIGRLVPDPDRDLFAWTFYAAGTMLIDFTDPANPRALSQVVPTVTADGTHRQALDAWYHNGYVFVGLDGGVEVFALR